MSHKMSTQTQSQERKNENASAVFNLFVCSNEKKEMKKIVGVLAVRTGVSCECVLSTFVKLTHDVEWFR